MAKLTLLGTWVSVDMPCFAYNFLHGGVGYYSFGSGKKDFSYTATDTAVTVHFTGDSLPSTFEYAIENDVLSIQDSFGTPVKYKLKKEDGRK